LEKERKIEKSEKKTEKNQWPQSGTKGKFYQPPRKIHLRSCSLIKPDQIKILG